MLESLEDAWRWYEDTRQSLRLLRRLSSRYWEELPWDGPLGQDGELRQLTGPSLTEKTDLTLPHLGDLAIVVLFSVFEATVRERVLKEIESEEAGLSHRVIRAAVQEAREQIEEGSFFRVLQPYKDSHADLVEQVNQVRRYRNWVAHGKRGPQPEVVRPRTALERLNGFLLVLQPQPPFAQTT